MDVSGGQGADGTDGADDGWDLFGPPGLEAVAGLVDARDSAYARGPDYTAAVRAAKLGEREVARALRRVMGPGVRVVTQAWCTEQGEPVVRVRVEWWPSRVRWLARIGGGERWVRTGAYMPVELGEVLGAQRLFTPAMRRAWVRLPAAVAGRRRP
jgi:hypothetical protein